MTARTYNELFERSYHLTLERESAQHWIVCDGETVMIRTPSCDTAVAFMRAFVAKTPGASMMSAPDTHFSWRVAHDALSERAVTTGAANMMPRGEGAFPGASVATSPRSESALATVHELRRPLEPLDESA